MKSMLSSGQTYHHARHEAQLVCGAKSRRMQAATSAPTLSASQESLYCRILQVLREVSEL